MSQRSRGIHGAGSCSDVDPLLFDTVGFCEGHAASVDGNVRIVRGHRNGDDRVIGARRVPQRNPVARGFARVQRQSPVRYSHTGTEDIDDGYREVSGLPERKVGSGKVPYPDRVILTVVVIATGDRDGLRCAPVIPRKSSNARFNL